MKMEGTSFRKVIMSNKEESSIEEVAPVTGPVAKESSPDSPTGAPVRREQQDGSRGTYTKVGGNFDGDSSRNRRHSNDGNRRGPRGQRSGGQGVERRSSKNRSGQQSPKKKQKKKPRSRSQPGLEGSENGFGVNVGNLEDFEFLSDLEEMESLAQESSEGGSPLLLNPLLEMPLVELVDEAKTLGVTTNGAPNRNTLIDSVIQSGFERRVPLLLKGVLETTDQGFGLLVFENDNYRIRPYSAFVSASLIKQYRLQRGQILDTQLHPRREGESCPFALKLNSVMDGSVDEIQGVQPFEDLVPYYPLERILLESNPDVTWDNLSMRIVDLLTPIGLGQRGLIVAPPRTGKTVLLQGIANSIALNNPDTILIVLLVDERPEEVTDFQRQVKGEVVSSTFDQSAESHVHAAEMVIEKSRRMVEDSRNVVVLLDSITRLARAYNTLRPSSGKILSGGVEASALQKPKRFFGSARNIEGGGSLTIIGTALIETGSRMDEVIFEEFKGTGNMELHLDRALVDKRMYPAINLERSGTRKEELLYHPDEMDKIYSLRRAMKGVPSTEAMEMLIQRVKKTKTNAEFLMGLNR